MSLQVWSAALGLGKLSHSLQTRSCALPTSSLPANWAIFNTPACLLPDNPLHPWLLKTLFNLSHENRITPPYNQEFAFCSFEQDRWEYLTSIRIFNINLYLKLLKKPPPKRILENSNRRFWEKQLSPNFKDSFLSKQKMFLIYLSWF